MTSVLLKQKFSFLGKSEGKCSLSHPEAVLMLINHFFISR